MKLVTLDNGFRIIIDHVPHVNTVSFGLWCNVGARNEILALNGASHFCEHMMFKGTHTRTSEKILDDASCIGGNINAYTNYSNTAYYNSCLSEYLPEGLELLADMILNSTFEETEVEKERDVIIQEILMYEDDPDDVAHSSSREIALSNQSLGRSVAGTVDTVSNIDRNALVAYYKKHYIPSKMVLSISGFIHNEDALIDQVTKLFGGMKDEKTEFFTEPFQFFGGEKRTGREISQINISMLFGCVDKFDERAYSVGVLSSILGCGITSRLFREVREKHGLCYGIGSYVDFCHSGGLFGISTSTDEEKVNKLLEITGGVIKQLKTDPPTDDEIKRALIQTKYSMVRSLEQTSSRSGIFGTYMMEHDKLFDINEKLEKYNKVNRDSIMEMVDYIFSHDPAIGLSGLTENVVPYEQIVSYIR